MNNIKYLLILIYCCPAFISCNIKSNSLTQENAEICIREFLASHSIKTSALEVSQTTIVKIGKTNIYSEYHTSVRTEFNAGNDQTLTLLFDFTRKPGNKWFLKSVEEVDDPLPELTEWLNSNKSLQIVAQ